MSRLSIGQRIASAFALLIVPIALVAIYFMTQQSFLFKSINADIQIDRDKIALLEGYASLIDNQQKIKAALLSENKIEFDALKQQSSPDLASFLRDPADDLINLHPSMRIIIDALNKELLIYERSLNQIDGAVAGGDWNLANSLFDNELMVISNRIATLTNNVQINGDQDAEGVSSQGVDVSKIQGDYAILILVSFGTIILLLLIVGVLLTLSVAIPFNQFKESIEEWSAGNFNHKPTIWGQSELKEMGETVDLLLQKARSGQKRILAPQMIEESTEAGPLLNNRLYTLETSLTIAQHAASVSDLANLLPRSIELLRQRYELYHIAVYLMDDQTDLLVLEAGTLINDRRTLPINEKSLPGWVAKHSRPGLIEDARNDARYYASTFVTDTKSELALPLMVGDLFLGVLDLHNASNNPFDRDHVLQFQSIADLIAMSVRRLQIIEGGRARRHLADALKGVGEVLISASLSDLFETMLHHTQSLVQYDGAAALLWDGKTLEISAVAGDISARKGSHITPDYNDPDDIFMSMMEMNTPYGIDLPKSKTIPHRWSGIFLSGCWLGIPFLAEIGIAGIVCFSRNDFEPFSAEDRSIAQTIVNQSWLALENAQQKQKIGSLRDQMEFELRNRMEAVQAAYADLEKLDQTKSRFVSIASHELKTPVTIIRGYGEILKKQVEIEKDPQNSRLVAGILTGVSRINELVENLLDLTRIDYRTLEIRPEPIRLRDLFDNLQSFYEPKVAHRNLTLVFDESTRKLPVIDADLVGIRKIFDHLVNNAIKYTPDGGTITVSGQAWTNSPPHLDWPEDGVHIMIKDSGIGIDPADHKLIFEKFFQIGEVDLHSSSKVEFRGGGPGLGLAIVRGIVIAHGGLVWAQSRECDDTKLPGSTFHVVMPRRQNQMRQQQKLPALPDKKTTKAVHA